MKELLETTHFNSIRKDILKPTMASNQSHDDWGTLGFVLNPKTGSNYTMEDLEELLRTLPCDDIAQSLFTELLESIKNYSGGYKNDISRFLSNVKNIKSDARKIRIRVIDLLYGGYAVNDLSVNYDRRPVSYKKALSGEISKNLWANTYCGEIWQSYYVRHKYMDLNPDLSQEDRLRFGYISTANFWEKGDLFIMPDILLEYRISEISKMKPGVSSEGDRYIAEAKTLIEKGRRISGIAFISHESQQTEIFETFSKLLKLQKINMID